MPKERHVRKESNDSTLVLGLMRVRMQNVQNESYVALFRHQRVAKKQLKMKSLY